MNSFECKEAQECPLRNICLALEANGVETGLGQNMEGECRVPEMLDIQDRRLRPDSVRFNPQMQENREPSELVGELGKAAYRVMAREIPPERRELSAMHKEVLEARINLWRAMLNAPRQNRVLTRQEKEAHEEEINSRLEAIERFEVEGQEGVLALAAHDSRSLDEYNVLFDASMIKILDRLAGNMMDGQPTLLSGDKGIAKTAAAKFMSRLSYDGEPLIISGHGDMGTNEFIGEVGLRDGKTYFKEGRIPQAAREGRPIILDEMDVTEVAVSLRLQDILLNIRPGKELVLQENGQDSIIVQPGFAVIATANEASKRYVHRQVSDPANRDRYDIIRLAYPDQGGVNTSVDVLRRNMANLRRLAYAAVSDQEGNITGITGVQLEKIVTLASATQLLYSEPSTSALRAAAGLDGSTTAALDDEPIMSDCISPRRLYTDLARLAPGNKPGFEFDSVLESLVQRLDEGDQKHNSKIARHLLGEIEKI